MTNTLFFFLLATLMLPLLSGIISLLMPLRYGRWVPLISTLIMLLSAFTALSVFAFVWNFMSSDFSWRWFTPGNHEVNLQLTLDNLSALMAALVVVISSLVHIYSVGYMARDSGQHRYFGMLGFFTFAMLGTVTAGNLFQLFFCWELIGFSSYMLIGHWRERPAAAAAAQKAFVMNRIGDAGLLAGLMIVWSNLGSLDLHTVAAVNPNEPWVFWAGLGIFLGVAGKSAQFPLLTWLPDAMEGPTPVSALIHAATMVAAGVFLLARVSPLLNPEMLIIITTTGAATALMGGLAAWMQFDIKKILAYSTISQLGLMVMAIGQGAPGPAMLHLFTHAFFKAALFLSAGAIIHALQQTYPSSRDPQDIRNMGGLRKQLPFTFIVFAIAAASLAGVPFGSGFLSKDAIFSSFTNGPLLVFGLALSVITVAYTFRMLWFIFFSEPADQAQPLHEPPLTMRIPMGLLALASVWFVVSVNPFQFQGWLLRGLNAREPSHFQFLTATSAAVVMAAVLTGYFYFQRITLTQNDSAPPGPAGIPLLDLIYHKIIVVPTIMLSRLSAATDVKVIDKILHLAAYAQVTFAFLITWLDKRVLDGSVNLAARATMGAGAITRALAGGKIQFYILWSALILVTLLIWLLFP